MDAIDKIKNVCDAGMNSCLLSNSDCRVLVKHIAELEANVKFLEETNARWHDTAHKNSMEFVRLESIIAGLKYKRIAELGAQLSQLKYKRIAELGAQLSQQKYKRIAELGAQLSQQSEDVQRDWASPYEVAGWKARIAELEGMLSTTAAAEFISGMSDSEKTGEVE